MIQLKFRQFQTDSEEIQKGIFHEGSHFARKLVFRVFDTNWAVQPQKMARGLKCQIEEGEGLY